MNYYVNGQFLYPVDEFSKELLSILSDFNWDNMNVGSIAYVSSMSAEILNNLKVTGKEQDKIMLKWIA